MSTGITSMGIGRAAVFAGLLVISLTRVVPAAEEPWKKEFDAVCSATTGSMSLSHDELQSLVERCDRLKPLLGGLEESARKVYLKRLEMCRNLLAFVLESKGVTHAAPDK